MIASFRRPPCLWACLAVTRPVAPTPPWSCSRLHEVAPRIFRGSSAHLRCWSRQWPRLDVHCSRTSSRSSEVPRFVQTPNWTTITLSIDHLHNYGPETRFGASQARIGRVVCVSHLSFRFSSALEGRSAITVVFLAFPIEARLVLHCFLMVFHGQVSSGSAGCLPFVRLTGRTSASPTARSFAMSTSSLRKNFAFMLVPKSLWTLPSPVLWNQVRLDTSRKQAQCHRCFLFARSGPKWEYEGRRRGESDMFAPTVVWAVGAEATH